MRIELTKWPYTYVYGIRIKYKQTKKEEKRRKISNRQHTVVLESATETTTIARKSVSTPHLPLGGHYAGFTADMLDFVPYSDRPCCT